jgi:hypothetical protein
MKSLIALTFAAALSSGAFAQQPPNYTPPPAGSQPSQGAAAEQAPSTAQTSSLEAIFDKLNVSHTGKLTRAEAQAHPTVAANFDAADTNHDGVLTKDEFLAAFRPAQ